jgi:hypothetical protein
MNVKVMQACVSENANQRDEQGYMMIFIPEVHMFANKLVLVETISKVAAGPLALLIVVMHPLVGSRAN